MRHLRSSLYKDLKLFFSGAGLLSLALPLLLLPALLFGMGDLAGGAFLNPFPIAVRDEDHTLMSASLISQIRRVELFSEVTVLDESMTDDAAIQQGAAAVVTIPEDFFYDLYVMKDCPVSVVLNGGMPLQASLFEAVLGSVMEIIRSDHAAGQGVYEFCYGAPTPQQLNEMYEQTGMTLVKDALGRQQVFSDAAAISDLSGALVRSLCATVLFVLACFFSLSAVKTLPEEFSLGVIPRLQAAGGSVTAFVLSKYLIALVLALPTFAAMCLLLNIHDFGMLLLLLCVMMFAAFGLYLALAAWTNSSTAVQRLGNLLLLANLVLGGTLWPRQMLPEPLFSLSKITLPYYGMLGLEALRRDTAVLPLLWPLAAMGIVGIALSSFGFRYSRVVRPVRSRGQNAVPKRLRSGIFRMIGMSAVKCRSMLGGAAGCVMIMAVLLLCGAAANAAQIGADSLRLAVCDLDHSTASEELVRQIQHTDGLSVTLVSEETGLRRLLTGDAEGLLTIGADYERQLEKGGDLPLDYESASGTVSGQGSREIIAGLVMGQKARFRAIEQAEELLGRSLSDDEISHLSSVINRFAEETPALYHISTAYGEAIPDPFMPDQMALCTLTILFVLLTAAPWCGGRDSRAAALRLRSLPGGRWLSPGSDCLALLVLGIFSGLCTLLPAGWDMCAERIPALVAASFCCSSLSLVLTRFSVLEGRVDGLAPLLALILCLFGGCFLNLTQLSPVLRTVSYLTPTGLTMAAANGHAAACAALSVLGIGLLACCIPGKKSL